MLKAHEQSNPNSCWNKAEDTERLFVLLARDVAAPLTILCWIIFRVIFGKNKLFDPQVQEAWDCAMKMQMNRPSPSPTIPEEPPLMTIRKACEIAQNRVGLTMAPLIRCWTTKPNYNCVIGLGGAGRDHTIMGAGDTWEQALNAMDVWLAGPKVRCNICNRPDCDTPNEKH